MSMNEQRWSKKYRKRVVWAVIILAVIICLIVPPLRTGLGSVFILLSSMDISQVVEYIRSFGPWAAVVSFCLMLLQSVAAPLPAFLITFANAMIFGWWQGAILSWSSAMAGAAVCFWIARLLGRDTVEKLASKTALSSVDVFFRQYGKHTILICRLLPFVSFDLVSYAAGLTGMSFGGFFLATGIGQLPATFVYSYVGGMLTGGARLFVTALLILFALTVLIYLFRKIYQDRKREAADEK
ncbi:TVP38/TMEM64 family protein [Desulfitobacterium hafniense]|nr:TVP38/TMEM64 family protein [Desulfitobacterium hafniense]